MKKNKRILIIFHQHLIPLRNTVKKYIQCFEKYSNYEVFYYNSHFKCPFYLKKINWDLIIFNTTFLIIRTQYQKFIKLQKNIEFFRKYNCIKVAFPQDEAHGGKYLCDFFNKFNINYIFSLLFKSSDIKIIYKDLKKINTVKFINVLAGYVDSSEIKKYKKYSKNKSTDFTYRVFSAKARNGYLGYQKIMIGNLFKDKLIDSKYSFDISTDIKKTIYGSKWIKFMASSKYTLGIEGGSSLYDPKYELRDKCLVYEKKNPNANFSKIEAKCFKNMDNHVNCAVITPRIFEAIMGKTCMILKEGTYNNILKKNIHYIPIKKDYSNIDNIIKNLNDKKRKIIINRCYKDLIETEHYSYESFVENFFKEIKFEKTQKPYKKGILNYINKFTFYLYDYLCLYLLFSLNSEDNILVKLIAKIKLKKIFYTNIAVYYTKRVIQLINK